MAPKPINLIPPVPPPGEAEARRAWAIKYRQSFTNRWGPDGGFESKAVAGGWAVSNQDLFQQVSPTSWGSALREFINCELRIDNAKPSNLVGPSGSWVKDNRRQMVEERAKGVRCQGWRG